MKRTERGFAIYGEYKDSRGNVVRIQESSAACGNFVWLFCHNKDGKDVVPCVGADGGHISVSPHLTKAQARRIALALLKFSDS